MWLAVKQEAADLIDLQIVAFPQEGIESYPNGRELMTRAIEMGADVVGGIPHYENTRDKGVSSVMFLMDLAQRYGRLVDVHCDEIDDPQSRFLEVLAEEARVRGMGGDAVNHPVLQVKGKQRLLAAQASVNNFHGGSCKWFCDKRQITSATEALR